MNFTVEETTKKLVNLVHLDVENACSFFEPSLPLIFRKQDDASDMPGLEILNFAKYRDDPILKVPDFTLAANDTA